MNADEFAKTVRSGDFRLRVDRVVVSAGPVRFRGGGTLRIVAAKFHLEVVLSRTSKAPGRGKSVWREADFWKLRALVEHSLPIEATHGSPHGYSSSGPIVMVTLAFGSLRIVESRWNATERKRALQLLADLRRQHAATNPPDPAARPRKVERKPAVACFTATLADYKLPARNASTDTIQKNSFFRKPATSWKADTLLMRGRDYDVALIQRGADVDVHFRSKGRYRSKSAAADAGLFQAVLDAIGFCYGFNAWPYRRQQWREGRQLPEHLSAPQRLPGTIHAPFDEALGQSGVPPILLVTRFFAQRSALSRKISQISFLFRQAGDELVHLPVQTLAFCSLFEGLVHLLFEELKLEKKSPKTDPDLRKFLEARDRLVAELREKGKAGDMPSQRLAGLLAQAGALRVKDKFNALCIAFKLDQTTMKPHFDAWYAERNPLAHGTWRTDRDTDFAHQARIAGAINILLLKLMGFAGRTVAVRFGEMPSETYRTI